MTSPAIAIALMSAMNPGFRRVFGGLAFERVKKHSRARAWPRLQGCHPCRCGRKISATKDLCLACNTTSAERGVSLKQGGAFSST